MTYIIDGHNLIPKVPGLSLEQMDDEICLIQRLIKFCQKKRARIVVYFDKAAPGYKSGSNYGAVSVIFVSNRRKADDAIHDYLIAHRREARNLTVVSSDRQVQRDASSLHSQVLSTETFAELLDASLFSPGKGGGSSEQELLTPDEVAEWEKLFTYHDK
jgi:predicted RNA-binding protein with PIN domain